MKSELKKCVACNLIHASEEGCPNCKCTLFHEAHPIFGFDTPETITEEANNVASAVAASFDANKIKTAIITVAESVIEVVSQVRNEDIEAIGDAYGSLVQSYGKVTIATMPVIQALSDIVDLIKEKIVNPTPTAEEAPASEA